MTDHLYNSACRTLLQPPSLLPAREILADRSLVTDEAGIYAWWFDEEIPSVPLEGTLANGSHRLLYVGIAPRAPSAAGSESKSTLRKRIVRNHLGRRIASSTLRRSLAWLLKGSLGFEIGRNAEGKTIMAREDEDRLIHWVSDHAAISFVCHEQAWHIEDHLITGGPALPLNLKGSTHAFRQQLTALRTTVREIDGRSRPPFADAALFPC